MIYGFRKNMMLLSFVFSTKKKTKSVFLISTMNHTIEINTDKKKPEMTCFYITKYGVDLLDMKCAGHQLFLQTVEHWKCEGFQWWPLDLDSSWVMPTLVIPHLQRSLADISNLPRDLKTDIQRILGIDRLQAEGVPDDRLQKAKCVKIVHLEMTVRLKTSI